MLINMCVRLCQLPSLCFDYLQASDLCSFLSAFVPIHPEDLPIICVYPRVAPNFVTDVMDKTPHLNAGNGVKALEYITINEPMYSSAELFHLHLNLHRRIETLVQFTESNNDQRNNNGRPSQIHAEACGQEGPDHRRLSRYKLSLITGFRSQ